MNHYRSYFNRVQVSEEQHQRLMEALGTGRRPRRTGFARPLRYGALAAGCALALLVGIGALRPADTPHGSGVAPSSDSPAAPSAPASPTTPPEDNRYTLLVEDPFQGQAHGGPMISGVGFTDCTGAPSLSTDIALPGGSFTEAMTAEEIIQALGGGDAVPWPLYWVGFGLTGSVTYNGQGQVWEAVIQGERASDGATLTLTLAPDVIPVRDILFNVETVDFEGLEVTAWYQHYDRDGDGETEYVYTVEFIHGTGVRFQVISREEGTADWLCACLLSHAARTDGMFTTSHLIPDEIPPWRSESLTEAQAYEEELGSWLPGAPAGFAFDSAHRELGQDGDWLTIRWLSGYDYVGVTVSRFPASVSPSAPDFKPEDITADALREWGRYVDNDAGDTAGWRYPAFTVHYDQEDGTTIAVTYSIKGLDPEEAARLVRRPAS